MRCSGLALLLGWMISCPQPAWAWGDGGHEMVAAIAYPRLRPHARAEVDRLLAIAPALPGQGTQDTPEHRFWHASHWPDDVKHTAQFAATADEHFIDFPFSPDGTSLPQLPRPVNILSALDRHAATLQGNAADAQKAEALRFLIHYVGDIHQPLHCSTRVTQGHAQGDTGGNEFSVKFRDPEGHLHTANLHSFWDGGLGSFPKQGGPPSFIPPPDAEIPPAVTAVLEANPANDPQIFDGGPLGFACWEHESSVLARLVAYGTLKPDGEASSAYMAAGVSTARQRVAWAGYRLAALLDAVWP